MDLGSSDRKPSRNQPESFLYQDAIFRKNRAEVSEEKVSILRVFTALHGRG